MAKRTWLNDDQKSLEQANKCPSGKTPFSTKKAALTGAARLRKERERILTVYKCRDCRKWHLTKQGAEG